VCYGANLIGARYEMRDEYGVGLVSRMLADTLSDEDRRSFIRDTRVRRTTPLDP
jgi:hypothetical protein